MFSPISVLKESIVTDGLVLWVDANDKTSYPGSGTIWKDLTTNGYTGTLTNGPTYSSTDGGSIVFDGVDDHVTTGETLNPIAYGLFADVSTTWSVSSWFLPPNFRIHPTPSSRRERSSSSSK